jgi:predicted Fe-Mo cluster-binding NifX family protein
MTERAAPDGRTAVRTRIAVPVLDDAFCEHFGRSNSFFLCDVEGPAHEVGRTRTVCRPGGTGKCESLHAWLAQMGITTLLVGGMGEVGRRHFDELGITVSVGHAGNDPLDVIRGFLAGPAGQRKNPCAGFEHRHRHCRGIRK